MVIPHKHLNSFWEKNISWYSPIGAWLTIALVALAQSELEWPKYLSHGPPSDINGLTDFKSLSSSSRKLHPLLSNA